MYRQQRNADYIGSCYGGCEHQPRQLYESVHPGYRKICHFHPGIIGTFGFRSSADHNKFEEVEQVLMECMPVVQDACAYIVCQVIDKMETSTHTVFLGKVLNADMLKKDDPMTYAYYHNVIKGKSPKNAPTYIGE